MNKVGNMDGIVATAALNIKELAAPFDIALKLSLVSCDKAIELVCHAFDSTLKPVIISFVNAHAFNVCFEEEGFYKALSSSDYIFRDGKGMEILYRSAGIEPGENLCGTDLIPLIINNYQTKKLALFGTCDPYITNAGSNLKSQGYNVVSSEHGFADIDHYLSLVEKEKPDIILLGMGMPKQEKLAAVLKESLNYPCLIINGGAIVDHLGGKVDRAPDWMRSAGLEWFFRLTQEPRRLFKRYVIGNFVFLKRVYKMTGTIAFK